MVFPFLGPIYPYTFCLSLAVFSFFFSFIPIKFASPGNDFKVVFENAELLLIIVFVRFAKQIPHKTMGDRKNIPRFLRCLQLRFFLHCCFCSSILFSTISGILEGSCRLFEDRILALQRKTHSLLVSS